MLREAKPELIRDFNPYNAVRHRGGARPHAGARSIRGIRDIGWDLPEERYGRHWVGDLAVECDLEVETARGELHLDLVEAGKHFTCKFDLETGQATLGVEGLEESFCESRHAGEFGGHLSAFVRKCGRPTVAMGGKQAHACFGDASRFDLRCRQGLWRTQKCHPDDKQCRPSRLSPSRNWCSWGLSASEFDWRCCETSITSLPIRPASSATTPILN